MITDLNGYFCKTIIYNSMKNSTIIKYVAILFFCTGISTFLVSCEDKKTEKVEVVAPAPNTVESNNTADQKTAPSGTADSKALNPAHGQPGHRCDIPVGAPLNGTTTTPTSGVPLNNTGTPVQLSSNINPAHGQPGHRCDVKVGDPLPN